MAPQYILAKVNDDLDEVDRLGDYLSQRDMKAIDVSLGFLVEDLGETGNTWKGFTLDELEAVQTRLHAFVGGESEYTHETTRWWVYSHHNDADMYENYGTYARLPDAFEAAVGEINSLIERGRAVSITVRIVDQATSKTVWLAGPAPKEI